MAADCGHLWGVRIDFDANVEVGMEEESVPEFREPIT